MSIRSIVLPKIGFGPGICGYSTNYKTKFNNIIFNKFYNKLLRYYQQKHYVKAIASAIEQGFRLIDFSASYGDGYLLNKGIISSSVSKDKIILTMRISNYAQYHNTIEDEFFNQLKNLKRDYIDILMLHWPVTEKYENTWKKILQLKSKGYCRMVGVANCHEHHIKKLYNISGVMPSINQIEVHPLFTQKNLIKFCTDNNITVESYTPIARFDDRLIRLPILKNISKKYNKTLSQIILRWHIQLGLIPIVRTLDISHQKENISIFDFELTDNEMTAIDNININARVRYDPDNCDFSIL